MNIKSYYWQGGHENGHSVEILTKAAYHKVLGVPAWDQDALEILAGYDPAPVGSDPDERLQL